MFQDSLTRFRTLEYCYFVSKKMFNGRCCDYLKVFFILYFPLWIFSDKMHQIKTNSFGLVLLGQFCQAATFLAWTSFQRGRV